MPKGNAPKYQRSGSGLIVTVKGKRLIVGRISNVGMGALRAIKQMDKVKFKKRKKTNKGITSVLGL
jgi:hypothetical protein